MAAQTGLCLAWSETPEDMFCHVAVRLFSPLFTMIYIRIKGVLNILQVLTQISETVTGMMTTEGMKSKKIDLLMIR